jgi:hypothetical protein
MGKTYIITSDLYVGEVVASYDDKGLLLGIDFSQAEINENQHIWMLNNIPKTTNEFIIWKQEGRKLRVEEFVVNFDKFWNKYDDKINSSKKRTKQKWDKMKPIEQEKAYRYIGRYFASIPYNTRKKYAETYLNAELWNN